MDGSDFDWFVIVNGNCVVVDYDFSWEMVVYGIIM